MQQVEQYVDGELDYIKLYGGTGPLVYPALHVYIYRMLYAITDKGRDIRLAQYIFGFVYLVTLTIVMACYRRCKVRSARKTQVSETDGLGSGLHSANAHHVQAFALHIRTALVQ